MLVVRLGDRTYPIPPAMIWHGPLFVPPGLIKLPADLLVRLRG